MSKAENYWQGFDSHSGSKCPKVTASTGIEPNKNPSSSTQSYWATVRTEEEEEAACHDADTIVIDSDVDNNTADEAAESLKEDPSESSDAELGMS